MEPNLIWTSVALSLCCCHGHLDCRHGCVGGFGTCKRLVWARLWLNRCAHRSASGAEPLRAKIRLGALLSEDGCERLLLSLLSEPRWLVPLETAPCLKVSREWRPLRWLRCTPRRARARRGGCPPCCQAGCASASNVVHFQQLTTQYVPRPTETPAIADRSEELLFSFFHFFFFLFSLKKIMFPLSFQIFMFFSFFKVVIFLFFPSPGPPGSPSPGRSKNIAFSDEK